jgi:hypothetical protein
MFDGAVFNAVFWGLTNERIRDKLVDDFDNWERNLNYLERENPSQLERSRKLRLFDDLNRNSVLKKISGSLEKDYNWVVAFILLKVVQECFRSMEVFVEVIGQRLGLKKNAQGFFFGCWISFCFLFSDERFRNTCGNLTTLVVCRMYKTFAVKFQNRHKEPFLVKIEAANIVGFIYDGINAERNENEPVAAEGVAAFEVIRSVYLFKSI